MGKDRMNTRPRQLSLYALPLVAGLLSFVYYYELRGTIVDEAFIALQYAHNLNQSLEWGLIAGRTANTATSPLNVILTAGVGRFVEDMRTAAVVLAALEATVLCGFMLGISRRIFGRRLYGIGAFLGLAANPLIVSTLGLESLLYVTLIVVALDAFLGGRRVRLAIVLGFLTLTRPDGVLLMSIFLVGGRAPLPVAHPDSPGSGGRLGRFGQSRLVFLTIYLAALIPWHLFSWLYLGSFIPDTFFLKLGSPWGGLDFVRGLPIYWSHYRVETFFSFWLLPVGSLLVAGRNEKANRLAKILLAFGALYFFAYSLLRVAPYHWYFSPLAAVTVLIGWLGAASFLVEFECRTVSNGAFSAWPGGSHGFERLSPVRVGSIGFACAAVAGVVAYLANGGALPPSEAPIHTNWATQEQYRSIGLWLGSHLEPTERISLSGEVGTISYYSQRQVYDVFGCRDAAAAAFHRFDSSGPVISTLLAINFRWLDPGPPCAPYAYQLIAFPDPQGRIADSSRVVMQWDISSRWVTQGRVFLVRLR